MSSFIIKSNVGLAFFKMFDANGRIKNGELIDMMYFHNVKFNFVEMNNANAITTQDTHQLIKHKNFVNFIFFLSK